jgi:hypothetical protein
VGIRDRLRRLQKAAQGHLECLELEDGGRYWYNPAEVGTEVFMHGVNSLHADFEGKPRPDPPEILQAIARARDRCQAVERLYPRGSYTLMAYNVEALIDQGEFVPRSFVVGREYGEPLEDLSEP